MLKASPKEERDNQWLERVYPAQFTEYHIERYQRNLPWKHHGAEDDYEKNIAAGESDSGEGVGCQDAGNENADDIHATDVKRIEIVDKEIALKPGLDEVFPVVYRGNPHRRSFPDESGLLACRREHPQPGNEE